MKYRLLLLLAALIWGFAFVAQVIGMDSIGPYAFNGIRFLLGSLSLLPIIYYYPSGRNPKEASFSIWVAILMAGILLCGGATLQQVALNTPRHQKQVSLLPLTCSWFRSSVFSSDRYCA